MLSCTLFFSLNNMLCRLFHYIQSVSVYVCTIIEQTNLS